MDYDAVVKGLTGPAWQAVLLGLVLFGGYKLANQLIEGLIHGLGEIRDNIAKMHDTLEQLREEMRPKQ